MMTKKYPKFNLRRFAFGCFFAVISLFSLFLQPTAVYADEIEDGAAGVVVEANEGTEEAESAEVENAEAEAVETSNESEAIETEDITKAVTEAVGNNNCRKTLGSIGWNVCGYVDKASEAVDWLYGKIKPILMINPVKAEENSPIYSIWKYFLNVANTVFVIFLLVVVWSQITGLGINNYGVKKALPKLIIAAVMVNLSFLICSLLVDISNVIGHGLMHLFDGVAVITSGGGSDVMTDADAIAMAQYYNNLGGAIALGAGAFVVSVETGAIWLLIPTVLGGFVSVAVGLITIAMRQAVVILLIMVAPLACVAYMLPNTGEYFEKWKKLLTKMLVFYPMYSLLFGASALAGNAIIMSSSDGFGVILGLAVRIFPLFFSWSLMKMSGTFLGTINSKLTGLFQKPLASNRAWAESHGNMTKAHFLQYGKTPYSRLNRYLDNRKALREKHTENLVALRKNDAGVYVQRKLASGYDGDEDGKDMKKQNYHKPNRYTKVAKDLSTSGLAVKTAEMDTTHALSHYDQYFVEKIGEVDKDGVWRASKKVKGGTMNAAENERSQRGADKFVEHFRATMTAEHDAEADVNFLTEKYLGFARGKDDRRLDLLDKKNITEKLGRGEKLTHNEEVRFEELGGEFNDDDALELAKLNERFNHYIVSSTGGLGRERQGRVLANVINRAATVEAKQRRDMGILLNKFNFDKTNFRNMFFEYHVNDNGIAIDKDGNELEEMPGQIITSGDTRQLKKLWWWENKDKDKGSYFHWAEAGVDIYKNDGAAVKEILSNFDIPIINDPVNNLYTIMTGNKEGKLSSEYLDKLHKGEKDLTSEERDINEHLKSIGAYKYRTTIGRAMLAFKDKNAMMSPMVAEQIKKGLISNPTELLVSYIDSLNKTTKISTLAKQDTEAIKMMGFYALNPEVLEQGDAVLDEDGREKFYLDYDSLLNWRNVNGEYKTRGKIDSVKMDRYDELGKKRESSVGLNDMEEREYRDLKESINGEVENFIYDKMEKGAKKVTTAAASWSPNTRDEQKPGCIDAWNKIIGPEGVFIRKYNKVKDKNGEVEEERKVHFGDKTVSITEPFNHESNMRELQNFVKDANKPKAQDEDKAQKQNKTKNWGMRYDETSNGGMQCNKIHDIIQNSEDPEACVDELIRKYNEYGRPDLGGMLENEFINRNKEMTIEDIDEYVEAELDGSFIGSYD